MYTDKGKIQKYLLTDIDDSFDAQIANWILAAKHFIDNYTGRTFESSEDETRYYDGNGEREIIIDSFVSLAGVWTLNQDGSTVDYTLTENDDYFAYPLNETVKYKLKLTPDSDIGSWTKGNKRIKVTARFGTCKNTSGEVPEDIEYAATMLVADIINQGRDGGIVESESLGDYSASFEDFSNNLFRITNVKKILDQYRIMEL